LGALQPQALEGQEPLREALSSVGPVAVTHNLLGARWSKLAINCAISTLGTVAGQPLGSLMLDVRARRLALEIITEVSTVAAAEGIVMERVPGLLDVRWLALKAQPRDGRGAINRATQWISRAIRHAFLLGMGLRYRRLRSSMLAAIERSRPAAVNFLNGEVVQHGDAVGIDAKVNRAAVAAVNDIAAGLKRPSWQELGALYAATR
jgi:2-dehydropantoate 2-reductase